MDNKFNQYIRGLSLRSGASQELINKVCNELTVALPDEFLEFIRFSNGAEGPIGEQEYLVLWPIEEIPSRNSGYKVKEYAPGLLLLGGDGGGEAYAFDTRFKELPIVQVPLIGLSLEEAIPRGKTFLEFLQYLSSN